MYIQSVNIGLPHLRRRGDSEVLTAGDKQPAPRAEVHTSGLAGDGQADRVNHGGPDKAVCVYALDHYPHWEQVLGRPLEPGAFSENLTVAGLREDAVCIGDIFQAGTALLQVTQPRTPCAKLAGKHGAPQLARWVADANATGFYMRVLQEGTVAPGDAFTLLQAHPDRISVAAVADIIFDRSADAALMAKLVALPAFGASGRQKFTERLARLAEQGG